MESTLAFKAKFIGINRHLDEDIKDLNGAAKDATALWALFSDNLQGIDAELIIDENATAEKVRSSIFETLANATPEDIVIISFSGHGSPDHHIVAHDTRIDRFIETSISMSTLADHFRSSRARTILFILDCCFSGDAASKVLENAPVPRSHQNPFGNFDGKGRILLAASNYDEPAYELPSTGHGLLTKAVIDILLSEVDSVSINYLIDETLKRVRSEASRIGREQNPAVIGHIEGGLELGSFKMGNNFSASFPEKTGVKVSNEITDLRLFRIPEECLSAWKTKFPNGLNDLQIEAVNTYRILDGKSLFVIAPTSSGKTFVGEMAAIKSIANGNKTIFLFPYKALVNEKFDYFSKLYGNELGSRIIRCTGDYTDQSKSFLKGKYDIAIFTYELFLSLIVSNKNSLNQVGSIVIDEAQFITDPNRGIIVELILTLLVSARDRGLTPQIIALSAVVGNANSFDLWLNIQSLVTSKRPVPLVEGVLDRTGSFKFVDTDGTQKTEQLIPRHLIVQRKKEPSSQDVIVPLVTNLLQTDAKIIVFRNRRGPAEGCAGYLANDLGLPPANAVISRLPSNGLSSASLKLRECLNGGTAFHSTNLTKQEKEAVEDGYRDPAGEIRVLASTTTLAAGINTPASTVIIAEQEFVGPDGRQFSIAEYKNMAGRAGRLGFNEKGKSIILSETPMQREQLFNKYVLGSPEPIKSSFDSQDLNEWAVRLLAQVNRIEKTDLIGMICNTYGGFLAARQNPSWKKQTELTLNQIVTEMIRLNLVEIDGEKIQLSLLGRVCGNASFPLSASMQLINILKNRTTFKLDNLKLMALLQVLEEDVMGFVPIFKKGAKDTGWSAPAAKIYGTDLVHLLQFGVRDNFEYEARCKKICLLSEWIAGQNIETIESNYTKNFFNPVGHGDILRIADTTRFHFSSAFEIASIVFPDSFGDGESHDNLMRQLEFGVPPNLFPLIEMGLELNRGDLLTLRDRNIFDAESFWALSSDEMFNLLGMRASEILALKPSTIK